MSWAQLSFVMTTRGRTGGGSRDPQFLEQQKQLCFNKHKCVSNKHTIKVCVSCCWLCPKTFTPCMEHPMVSLYFCSSGSHALGWSLICLEIYQSGPLNNSLPAPPPLNWQPFGTGNRAELGGPGSSPGWGNKSFEWLFELTFAFCLVEKCLFL